MAQAPTKHNPLHTPAKHEQVHTPGMPPKPHMAPHGTPEGFISDSTQAEMNAGKKALTTFGERANAEHSIGRHIIARHGERHQDRERSPRG